jgi:hypothetical protein
MSAALPLWLKISEPQMEMMDVIEAHAIRPIFPSVSSVPSVVRFQSSDLIKNLFGNDWFGNPWQVSISTKLSSTALQRLPRQLPVA